MSTWIAWAVFAGIALALGFTGYHFTVRTVRFVTVIITLALMVTVTTYGLRYPATPPPDLFAAFTRGADGIAQALFDAPKPGKTGWIIIGVLLFLGYRELEAWTMRWQAPVLDTSRIDEDQPRAQFSAELRFRLSAMEVRSPSILPGGSRASSLASIAETSGAPGGGLAGAVIRLAGALWPGPRRLQLRVWVEAPDPGTSAQTDIASDTKVTVELADTASGAPVATKTVAARDLDEAASIVAGYVARQIFTRDPSTPAWCYGAADGRDLGVLQLARRERVDVARVDDIQDSRLEQIRILGQVSGAGRCAGLVRYELAQLLDLEGDQVSALRLHALNREQYPRFFRGRYRLAMSLEMITSSGFIPRNRYAAWHDLDQTLGSLHRSGLTTSAGCPADNTITGAEGSWTLSQELKAELLSAARAELLSIRRQLTFPAVAWATFRRRDERTTWGPHWRLPTRQAFRDGVEASLLLVAVRQRLNDPRAPAASTRGYRKAPYRKALRIASAITGDSDPIVSVLRCPGEDWKLTGGPPRVTRDRVRYLPWLNRTASWQAAYAIACLYAALALKGLAGDDRVVASLRRAGGSRSSEMERPYDWIMDNPDFAPMYTELDEAQDEYPAFMKFLDDQMLLDYPDPEEEE